ncbi:MAG: protein-L-isoaspartate(D-aspartate) O-methyltransferase [Candidatus Omnitrophica bacterium]|jgi:protein-L-isoaspartate(D-aspartate) O-methyltransferase|nr:protein-L-isoaspartate(D-aspartate) O-methyltransferase [Candidatus Omnitrophota bacterium]
MMKRLFIIVLVCVCASNSFGEDDGFAAKRRYMVDAQIKARGVSDLRVLEVMKKVPRHLFIPENIRHLAYEDYPLPIGWGQTISQPYIVGFMTEAAGISSSDKVLEIGTGSGYQAAVLSELAGSVYTVEIVEELAALSVKTLAERGYGNVHVRYGNGYEGWPEEAPFDVIMVTAAPPGFPEKLMSQLKEGGRMVLPVGTAYQQLYVVERTPSGFKKTPVLNVRFVPMIGENK